MEVYDDHVIDLLSLGSTLRTPLQVRHHPVTGPHVTGRLRLVMAAGRIKDIVFHRCNLFYCF